MSPLHQAWTQGVSIGFEMEKKAHPPLDVGGPESNLEISGVSASDLGCQPGRDSMLNAGSCLMAGRDLFGFLKHSLSLPFKGIVT